MKKIGCLLLLCIFSTAVFGQDREITHLSGDLYHFRNQAHVSLFLVTDEGVIATDPISKPVATWLQDEIEKRFDREVRYLIYSHSDEDHIAGGQVFSDTAVVIAHENAQPVIASGDYTAEPDIVFRERLEVSLGGQRVVLHDFGKSHTDNLVVIEYPAERTIFVVDSISNNRLPYRTLNRWFMPEGIEFMKQVEQMDFDVFVPGHGTPGTKADVIRHREYMEALYEAVKAAKASGLGLEEAQTTIQLPEFSDMGRYDEWLGENIEGMYRLIPDD
jgi:glyoxylase-like metal-dependent hydrolase (beta-lactamase superfamily II)